MLESNEKTGTFISARQSPKWIKTIEQPNKWMRTHEKKINFQEKLMRAKQPPIKLDKRPKTSKRIPPQSQSKIVAGTKATIKLPATVVQAPQELDYHKVLDALQYSAVAEKCILLEALRWVSEQRRYIRSEIVTEVHLQRLTKSKDIAPSETIQQFIAHDLLKLKANRLLSKLLWPLDDTENALVQQNCVASLLNAIVSHKEGRRYFDGTPMFETLTASALGDSLIEKNTLDNLIATMAKLSINVNHRQDFAKRGECSCGRQEDKTFS